MRERRKYDHVFVLCTEGCDSLIFSKACAHFTNYTSGHETRCAELGAQRLAYPIGHIEADNRLAWFLGRLDNAFGDRAFFVHLVRDKQRVAETYDGCWDHRYSLMSAFNFNILMRREADSAAVLDMVETISANIENFLASKSNKIQIDIDRATDNFMDFATAIDADGDLNAALAEFELPHNAIETRSEKFSTGHEAFALDDGSRSIKSNIARTNQMLKRENHQLQLKIGRLDRRLFWLAVPYAAATFPISLPLWAYRKHKGNRKKRIRRASHLVSEAFTAFYVSGPDSAMDRLTEEPRLCPPGIVDLFEAKQATTDDDWLRAMNSWGRVHGLPEFSLHEADAPRFLRLSMSAEEAIHSPDKVSIIMPAYNAEALVEQAVRSLLHQSWSNIELIVVNDHSTDETGAILDRIAATDLRMKVVHNPVNVGPYVSKNIGVRLATGKYVTGHDADDIATPSRIADQMAPLIADSGIRATIAYMLRVDKHGNFSFPTIIGDNSIDGAARTAYISLLIERDVLINSIGYWDSVRLSADSEMLARAEAYLGSGLKRLEKIVMLCLDSENSLTNHPAHGLKHVEGVSPIRAQYSDSWGSWHSRTTPMSRFIDFPQRERNFAAPAEMVVSIEAQEDVLKVHKDRTSIVH